MRQIVEAIQGLRCLRVVYGPGERVIEPHTLGYGSSGQILLRAYQTEGVSESGEPNDWKLLRVDQLIVVAAGDCFSGPRPGYTRSDSVMKGGIIAEL